MEVARQERQNTLIACNLGILDEDFEHDHTRPPIIVGGWAKLSVPALTGKDPLNPGLYVVYESLVFQEIGQGEQTIQIIGASLPVFTAATKPATIGANICPYLAK